MTILKPGAEPFSKNKQTPKAFTASDIHDYTMLIRKAFVVHFQIGAEFSDDCLCIRLLTVTGSDPA